MRPKESDWKTFRKHVPEWRERYLKKKNREIIGIFIDEDKTPTERFWEAKEIMDEQARILVNCLKGHSRSKMFEYFLLMYRYGFIEDADLEEFSETLQELIL